MKVAICSSNGISVNMHFGKTSTFYIYDFRGEERIFLEKREVRPFSQGKFFYLDDARFHPFNKDHFAQVYATICDCELICTSCIGHTPKRKLSEKGHKIHECKGPITNIPTHIHLAKFNYYLS
ncbi:MAG: hypothetical protein HC819_20045 [Cyclobacteriaceae bacterium]|nr:hypothetical protein [Cyclobacteriaceae bacterium]